MDFDFIKNIFKKKPNVADVLSALERFAPDQNSLADIGAKAAAYFGSDWRFNLEMYVNSMPSADREIYAPLVSGVLSFDKALSLWLSATRIVKGAKSLSPDVARSLPEYEEHLPKFGIEGARLLDKFRKALGVSALPSAAKPPPGIGTPQETSMESKAETGARILKKVSRDDLQGGVFYRNSQNTNGPGRDTSAEPAMVSDPDETIPPAPPAGEDWEIGNFMRMRAFLSVSREMMSSIVVGNGYKLLEDYPYYGFVLDAIGHAISSGERLLAGKSDAEIARYFEGGRKELESILEFYRNEAAAQLAEPAPKEGKDGEEASLGYVRVNRDAIRKPK